MCTGVWHPQIPAQIHKKFCPEASEFQWVVVFSLPPLLPFFLCPLLFFLPRPLSPLSSAPPPTPSHCCREEAGLGNHGHRCHILVML